MGLKRENLRMMGKLSVIVLGMFGFGYALVPLYIAICEMTGINVLALSDKLIPGASSKQAANTQVDRSRTITVEFDANARGPWQFKPAVRSVQVHPGELSTVMYEFQNVQDRTMSAQAIPSYAPRLGAAFQQARVLLLQPVHPGSRREKSLACGLCDRSQIAQRRDHHHLVLHLLRGGWQSAARTGRHGGRLQCGAGGASRRRRMMTAMPAQRPSFLRTVKAVAWSFIGLRARQGLEEDVRHIHPLHVVLGGLVGVFVFVGGLIALVRWMVG